MTQFGVHPTVRPEECLEHADLVCVGEGEEALSELVAQMADGGDHAGIRNIWYKRNGEIVLTPLRPPASNLDAFPYPDYDLTTEFVLHQDRLQPMTRDFFHHYLGRFSRPFVAYETLTSRGCPHRCTYCVNDSLRRAYSGDWRVRRRSIPNVIGELKQIVARFPEIQRIIFHDEFFLDDTEIVREFCSAYKLAIAIPFWITSFHPAMVDEERIGLLVDAGMERVYVSIETGSMRVMHQVYQRACTQKQITQALQVLHRFTDRCLPKYNFIVDNPWETEEDQMETLRMLLRLRKPYLINFASLTFYPGTALHERAKREGLITNDLTQVYLKNFAVIGRTYINSLFRLFRSQYVPRWLIALLMTAPLRRLKWVWLPEQVYRLFELFGRAMRGLRRLLRGDLSPVRNVLHGSRSSRVTPPT